jgi:hypothetical protein
MVSSDCDALRFIADDQPFMDPFVRLRLCPFSTSEV